jgi:hypothetical protein
VPAGRRALAPTCAEPQMDCIAFRWWREVVGMTAERPAASVVV